MRRVAEMKTKYADFYEWHDRNEWKGKRKSEYDLIVSQQKWSNGHFTQACLKLISMNLAECENILIDNSYEEYWNCMTIKIKAHSS